MLECAWPERAIGSRRTRFGSGEVETRGERCSWWLGLPFLRTGSCRNDCLREPADRVDGRCSAERPEPTGRVGVAPWKAPLRARGGTARGLNVRD
jgi:hypothetical protein